MASAAVSSKELEFTTLVRVDGFGGDFSALARDVEAEIVRILADEGVATVAQYFARPVNNGVQIGLRFRGMPAMNAQSTAEDLVTEAVNTALKSGGAGALAGRIASTTLAGV